MTTLQIFLLFFRMSLISLGGVFGVLPEMERLLLQHPGWITHEQFMQAFVISQFLPGPNMAMCPLIGFRIAGWPGFFAAFFGIYAFPTALMAAVSGVYRRFRKLEPVRRAEIALRPMVIGLLLASVIRFAWIQGTGLGVGPAASRIAAAVLIATGFWAYRRKLLSPIPLIFASGAVWWLAARLFPLA